MLIEFNETEHRYIVNGKSLPSVTKILMATGIVWFPENAKRDYYLMRGTYVHEAIRLINTGSLDESTIDDEIKGYVDAYRAFCREVRFEPEMVEYRSAHLAAGYAGTLDCVGKIGGVRAMVDFKSGAVNEKAVRLQTAAYALMDGVPAVSARYGLELKKDGTYKLSKPYTEHRRDQADFLMAVGVYWMQSARIDNGKVVMA